MTRRHHPKAGCAARRPWQRLFGRDRCGATSLLFAIMAVPLLLVVGLATDFSFYIQAQAQLDLAADAAAMHAVRAAAMATSNGTNYTNAGTLAGQQWFAAQAEVLPGVTLTGTGSPLPVSVSISYTAPKYTATVSYTGTLNTFFGPMIGIRTWPVSGSATSVIADNFVDIGLLIDNSQSMLIGATASDAAAMNMATPCAKVTTQNGVTPGLSVENYSFYLNGAGNPWAIGVKYGYNTGETLPPYTGYLGNAPAPATQFCDPNYLPGCGYPPGVLYGVNAQYYLSKPSGANIAGACNNGGGAPGAAGPNTPQAPCALACHQNTNGGDFYAVARATTNPTTGNPVQLRLDVVQSAAQSVIQAMEQYSPPPQTLLGVGVYTFNSSFQPLYPCTSTSGCTSPFGTNLAAAYSDLTICSGTQTTGCLLPPITTDSPNTDIADSFSQAAAFLAGSAGNGSTPATAFRNLFIVTDGISDWSYGATSQVVGPLDQLVANPCQQLKSAGFTIYVLYTPYEPIPTWTYSYSQQPASPTGYTSGWTLQNFVTQSNPTNFPNYNPDYPNDTPVMAALRACASNPQYFYTASNQADITAAMNAMLASALNGAARVTN